MNNYKSYFELLFVLSFQKFPHQGKYSNYQSPSLLIFDKFIFHIMIIQCVESDEKECSFNLAWFQLSL